MPGVSRPGSRRAGLSTSVERAAPRRDSTGAGASRVTSVWLASVGAASVGAASVAAASGGGRPRSGGDDDTKIPAPARLTA